jgi:glutamate-1-semialdehyde aminotransferase
VISEDTDATAGDQTAPAYMAGTFNTAAVIFAAGTVASDYASYLQQQFGIYLKDVVPVNSGV